MNNNERIDRSMGVWALVSLDAFFMILLSWEVKKPGFTFLGFVYGSAINVLSIMLIYHLSKLFRKRE